MDNLIEIAIIFGISALILVAFITLFLIFASGCCDIWIDN